MISPNSSVAILGQFIYYSTVLICITISIYGNYRIIRVSDAIFIAKRFKSLLFGLNVTLIIQIMSMVPGFISRIYSHPSSALSIASLALTTICLYLFLFFSITKSWMIYWKERFTFYTLQLEWQQHIAPNNNHTNWFILNNYRYGSLSYMYKLFGVYHLSMLAIVGVAFLHTEAVRALTAFLVTMPFFVTVAIYMIIICKTRRLSLMDDVFYIHWEAKVHTRILCGYLVVFIVNQVLIQVINDTVIESCIFGPIYCLLVYGLHHVSSYAIYHKNSDYLAHNHAETSTSSPSTTHSSGSEHKIEFYQILSNADALHLFMLHLCNENSMECLLAYIELKQYLEYLQDTEKETVDMNDKKCNFAKESDVRLPSEVPISAIVTKKYEDKEHEECIKLKGYELYQKYIVANSEFEVNISWEQRAAAMSIFDDKTVLLENKSIKGQDIFNAYQSIMNEMYRLLFISGVRFKSRPDHEKVIMLFKNNNTV